MKFKHQAFALAVLSSSASVAMAEEQPTRSNMGLSFSGNAALTTDYRFRGMTQTQSDPAVQGSFTLTHTSGLYLSAFASNVNFGPSDPHLELDPSLGFAKPLNLSAHVKPILDIGVIVYAKLTFADIGVKGSSLLTNLNYTNDWAAVGGKSWNFTFAYAAPIADTGFGGIASVGYTHMEKDVLPDAKDHYVDWKVGVNYGVKSIPGLSAELAAIGTNVDIAGLTAATQRGLETGAVLTLSKAF